MAKFRSTSAGPLSSALDAEEAPNGAVHDRAIGDILGEAKNLSAEQVEQILAYQVQHGV